MRRTDRALAAGALLPIATDCETVEQGGIAFAVRILAGFDGKPQARLDQAEAGTNPFLPYDEELFVADVSETHVCLLNKFSVLDHHLLVVTREFEDQESLLGERDFHALWTCMAEFDAFAFYNAGEVAGASQPHKHLQLVPVPLGRGPERTPLDRLLRSAGLTERVGRASGLPFLHALAGLGVDWESDPEVASRVARRVYLELLHAVGCDRTPRPYNLLLTREWMLLVPRSRSAWHSVAVNALGFAGALLVRDREGLDLVRRMGPLDLLAKVAFQPDSDP